MKPIPNFPGYFADADGHIWTIKRKGGNARAAGMTGSPRRLTPHLSKRGYCFVNLDIKGKTYARAVHRLVLETFVGPCPNGMEACHYPSADKSNNRLNNLRWDKHRENIRDKVRDRGVVTEKRCRTCGNVKARSEFYRDSRASDGMKTECKTCHAETALRTRDPEKKRTANREYMRRHRAA